MIGDNSYMDSSQEKTYSPVKGLERSLVRREAKQDSDSLRGSHPDDPVQDELYVKSHPFTIEED